MEFNEEKLREFLSHPQIRDMINLRAIEEVAGIPEQTLYRFRNGRALPKKHRDSLLATLNMLCYDYYPPN